MMYACHAVVVVARRRLRVRLGAAVWHWADDTGLPARRLSQDRELGKFQDRSLLRAKKVRLQKKVTEWTEQLAL